MPTPALRNRGSFHGFGGRAWAWHTARTGFFPLAQTRRLSQRLWTGNLSTTSRAGPSAGVFKQS